MPEQIPARIKNERYRYAMTLQQRIAREIAGEKVGRELRLLVDQPLVARTQADAPDIDTRVILTEPAAVGEFTTRRITGSRGYDLLA
jgi:ribosomal protein S12 methylthiotransferase